MVKIFKLLGKIGEQKNGENLSVPLEKNENFPTLGGGHTPDPPPLGPALYSVDVFIQYLIKKRKNFS